MGSREVRDLKHLDGCGRTMNINGGRKPWLGISDIGDAISEFDNTRTSDLKNYLKEKHELKLSITSKEPESKEEGFWSTIGTILLIVGITIIMALGLFKMTELGAPVVEGFISPETVDVDRFELALKNPADEEAPPYQYNYLEKWYEDDYYVNFKSDIENILEDNIVTRVEFTTLQKDIERGEREETKKRLSKLMEK